MIQSPRGYCDQISISPCAHLSHTLKFPTPPSAPLDNPGFARRSTIGHGHGTDVQLPTFLRGSRAQWPHKDTRLLALTIERTGTNPLPPPPCKSLPPVHQTPPRDLRAIGASPLPRSPSCVPQHKPEALCGCSESGRGNQNAQPTSLIWNLKMHAAIPRTIINNTKRNTERQDSKERLARQAYRWRLEKGARQQRSASSRRCSGVLKQGPRKQRALAKAAQTLSYSLSNPS